MDYNIDLKGKRLGRAASEVAVILQGKKSVRYAPNAVGGDRVIVKNVDKLTVSGSKMEDKVYYKHTGYMGHLNEIKFSAAFKKDPRQLFRDTVRRMLPKNFLNQKRLNNLLFEE